LLCQLRYGYPKLGTVILSVERNGQISWSKFEIADLTRIRVEVSGSFYAYSNSRDLKFWNRGGGVLISNLCSVIE